MEGVERWAVLPASQPRGGDDLQRDGRKRN